MADPVKGPGDPAKVLTKTPAPNPSPITPPFVPIKNPALNPTTVTVLLQVGPGSNPEAYAPNPSLPISGPDPTKGNVAAVLGYVGPLLEDILQSSSPPITCAVFGQGNLSCPGVVGVNGQLEDKKGQLLKDPDAAGDGVFGFGSVNGVHGIAITGTGVGGNSTSGDGIYGKSTTGVGVHGQSLGSGGLAGKFEGPVEIDGDITAVDTITVKKDIVLTGADCAEQFDMYDAKSPEPGTIVVIDDEGKLRQSYGAYDKRVAGVVSGAGEYRPAIVLDRRASSENRVSVALVGKVYCKVDADPAAITVGDLLTTSGRPGFAMKATDPAQAFGAVIGKALKPFPAGQGTIPILVALQ